MQFEFRQKTLPSRPFSWNNHFSFFWMKPISVKEESGFKSNNIRHSILALSIPDVQLFYFFLFCLTVLLFSWYQMFDFPFVDLYLNLLRHMQKCRFRPVIIRIATKKPPATTSRNKSIIDGAISCPHFFITQNLILLG